MRRSLRARLAALWVLIAVICAALAAIMLSMYFHGADVQIHAGQDSATEACAGFQSEYARYLAGPGAVAPPGRDFLSVLMDLLLRDRAGVEGGVWDPAEGFIAYAYPTYEGSGVKRDVPEAEQPRIATLARRSLDTDAPQVELHRGQREASIVAACPLAGNRRLAAWTMTRVPAALGSVYDRLLQGLAVLLVFVIGSGVWLGVLLHRWSARLTHIERALGQQTLDHLPALALSGEQELDRIVTALNEFSTRLRQALEESAKLSQQLAQADRLAALGRLAAGLAHEIRNPIAAMRLKAENALARPVGREGPALQAILGQIARLDKLLASMLAMTQPLALTWQTVPIAPWLTETIQGLRDAAERKQLALTLSAAVPAWTIDPLHLGRAVENLLWNSVHHTPPGGEIHVEGTASRDRMVLRVRDTGPGVPPEIKDRLFEPFASSRPDGTGLGLALVREIAAAHGGSVRYVEGEPGACFELEVPWHAS